MIVTHRIEETGHLRCSFDYMLYTPTSLSLFSLKNETEVFKGDQQLPLEILISTDRKLFFYVYDYWIDLVWVGLDSLGLQDSELQNRTSPAKRTFRVKVSRRIRSYYLWEEILFYTDDNDVWLCYPALYNSEPLKIKLASNFPSSKSQVKPSNLCHVVGIIDQKLVITNNDLEILPIELNSPLLSFYFKLKAGNAKSSIDLAKSLNTHDQTLLLRTCLYLKNYKLCLLFTCFPLLLSKEYKTIFPDLLLLKDFEGHYEYFMVFAKIFRNTAGTQKKKIQEEIVKYKSYESVSSSEKLLDIIEMFLDSE